MLIINFTKCPHPDCYENNDLILVNEELIKTDNKYAYIKQIFHCNNPHHGKKYNRVIIKKIEEHLVIKEDNEKK